MESKERHRRPSFIVAYFGCLDFILVEVVVVAEVGDARDGDSHVGSHAGP
jgi:hypothetical protein